MATRIETRRRPDVVAAAAALGERIMRAPILRRVGPLLRHLDEIGVRVPAP